MYSLRSSANTTGTSWPGSGESGDGGAVNVHIVPAPQEVHASQWVDQTTVPADTKSCLEHDVPATRCIKVYGCTFENTAAYLHGGALALNFTETLGVNYNVFIVAAFANTTSDVQHLDAPFDSSGIDMLDLTGGGAIMLAFKNIVNSTISISGSASSSTAGGGCGGVVQVRTEEHLIGSDVSIALRTHGTSGLFGGTVGVNVGDGAGTGNLIDSSLFVMVNSTDSAINGFMGGTIGVEMTGNATDSDVKILGYISNCSVSYTAQNGSGYGGVAAFFVLGDVLRTNLTVDLEAEYARSGTAGGVLMLAIDGNIRDTNFNIAINAVNSTAASENDASIPYGGAGGGGVLAMVVGGITSNLHFYSILNAVNSSVGVISEEAHFESVGFGGVAYIDLIGPAIESDITVLVVNSDDSSSTGDGGVVMLTFRNELINSDVNVTTSCATNSRSHGVGGTVALIVYGKVENSNVSVSGFTNNTKAGVEETFVSNGGAIFLGMFSTVMGSTVVAAADVHNAVATGSGGAVSIIFENTVVNTGVYAWVDGKNFIAGGQGGTVSLMFDSQVLNLVVRSNIGYLNSQSGSDTSGWWNQLGLTGGVVYALFTYQVDTIFVDMVIRGSDAYSATDGGVIDMLFMERLDFADISVVLDANNTISMGDGGTAHVLFNSVVTQTNLNITGTVYESHNGNATLGGYGGVLFLGVVVSLESVFRVKLETYNTSAVECGGVAFTSIMNGAEDSAFEFDITAKESHALAGDGGVAFLEFVDGGFNSSYSFRGASTNTSAFGDGGALYVYLDGKDITPVNVFGEVDYVATNSHSTGNGGVLGWYLMDNRSVGIHSLNVKMNSVNTSAGGGGGCMYMGLPTIVGCFNITISGLMSETTSQHGEGGAINVNIMGQNHALEVERSSVTIKDLEVFNGTSRNGGGAVAIRTFDNMMNWQYSFVNCHFQRTDSVFGIGGAILIESAGGETQNMALNVIDCTIDGATAGGGGGSIALNSDAWLISEVKTRTGMSYKTKPKGVCLNCIVEIRNLQIIRSAATRYGSNGGALYLSWGPWGEAVDQTAICGDAGKQSMMQVNIDTESSFTNCSAASSGGAIYVDTCASVHVGTTRPSDAEEIESFGPIKTSENEGERKPTSKHTLFEDSEAKEGSGGGIMITHAGSMLKVDAVQMIRCRAASFGSAIYSQHADVVLGQQTTIDAHSNTQAVDRVKAVGQTTTKQVITIDGSLAPGPEMPIFGTSDSNTSASVMCDGGESLIGSQYQTVWINEMAFSRKPNSSGMPVEQKWWYEPDVDNRETRHTTVLACSQCPAGTYSMQAGTTMFPMVECNPCPDGVVCYGSANVFARHGSWIQQSEHLTNEGDVLKTPTRPISVHFCSRCQGCATLIESPWSAMHAGEDLPDSMVACQAEKTRNWCKEGRPQPTDDAPNVLCGSCIQNETHTFIEFGAECRDCSGDNWRGWAKLLGLYCGLLVLLMIISWNKQPIPFMKMFIYFSQIHLLMSGDQTLWLATSDALGIVCAVPTTKVLQLWFNLLRPFITLSLLGIMAAVFGVWLACCRSLRPKLRRKRYEAVSSATKRSDASADVESGNTIRSVRNDHSAQMVPDTKLKEYRADPDWIHHDDDELLISDDDELLGYDPHTMQNDRPSTGEMAIVSMDRHNAEAAGSLKSPADRWISFRRCAHYIMLVTYTMWANHAGALLKCVEVGPHFVIAAHPDVSCESAEYSILSVLAVLVVLLVLWGYPLWLILFLYKNREELHLPRMMYGTHGIMYAEYVPSVRWWWPATEMLRRVVFVGIELMTTPSGGMRGFLIGTAGMLILCLHVWVKPYTETALQQRWRTAGFLLNYNVFEGVLHFLIVLAGFSMSIVPVTDGNINNLSHGSFMDIPMQVAMWVTLLCSVISILLKFAESTGYFKKRCKAPMDDGMHITMNASFSPDHAGFRKLIRSIGNKSNTINGSVNQHRCGEVLDLQREVLDPQLVTNPPTPRVAGTTKSSRTSTKHDVPAKFALWGAGVGTDSGSRVNRGSREASPAPHLLVGKPQPFVGNNDGDDDCIRPVAHPISSVSRRTPGARSSRAHVGSQEHGSHSYRTVRFAASDIVEA
jgi:hypothetical protein